MIDFKNSLFYFVLLSLVLTSCISEDSKDKVSGASLIVSGDCDDSCNISTNSYNLTLTEGSIESFLWTAIDNGTEWAYTAEVSGVGIIYSSGWVLDPTVTATTCVNTTEGDVLNVYCSNSNAANNWTFYDDYIKLVSVATSGAYRVYAYFDYFSDNDVEWNGTTSSTTSGGYNDWDSSTGTFGLSDSTKDNILVWTWNESVRTDFDYYGGDVSNQYASISIARGTDIASGTPLTQYVRVYEKNSSASGDAQYVDMMACFKADPSDSCVYESASDSCTYVSGDHTYECSDNCSLSSTQTVDAGATIIINGSGTFTGVKHLSGASTIRIMGGCNAKA